MYEYHDAPSVSAFPAVPLGYELAVLAGATWTPVGNSGLEARDLLFGRATKAQMGSRHVRAAKAGSADRWPGAAGLAFRFLYVLAGSATFEVKGQEPVTLVKDDVPSQAFMAKAGRVTWEAGFEAVEIVAPDWSLTATPPVPVELLAGLQDMTGAGNGEVSVSRNGPDAFVTNGLRPFMVYRDLGTTRDTDGRMHIHVVRAIDTLPGGTGWHVHSMSQIFYVLRGWVNIAVDGQGVTRMVEGDAMCIANGMRHNVFEFSHDYDVLELCMPAEYSTVATPAPADVQLEPAMAK